LLLLGEQATGKSSLLAALYGALIHNRAGNMRLVRTVDDVAFLSRGLEALGRRESVSRTEVGTQARLLIEVEHRGRRIGIELPDRSGEMLKHMLDTRVWDHELHQHLTGAAGALLFLRADADMRADAQRVQWSPALMPTDARAVDLAQALLEERATTLPLVVIVSAWDRAAAHAALPPTWLVEHLPLLDQFLTSHAEQLPHAVFGVSAQGGDFGPGDPGPADAEDPWDRAFLIGPDGMRATFAEPISWLVASAAVDGP
jgi:hypothetical protein